MATKDGYSSFKDDPNTEINSKKLNDLNIFDSKEHEKICLNLKNSSTLSLHISAYENSVADAENGQNSDKNGKNSKQNTSGKNSWKIFKNFALTSKLEFEEQFSLQQLIPIIFEKADLPTDNYEVQTVAVLNKQNEKYVTVNDQYLLQSYDKFQVYLVKKEQPHETVAIISAFENEQQKLPIDTSKVTTAKELSQLLSQQMDVKDGNILIQKFDEDFGENLDVNEEDKFDPTKTYNIKVQKILHFDVVVAPNLVADSSSRKFAFKSIGNDEAFKPSVKVEKEIVEPASTAMAPVSSLAVSEVPSPLLSNLEPGLKNSGNNEAIEQSAKTEKEILQPASTVAAPVSPSAVSEAQSPLLPDAEIEKLQVSIDEKSLVTSAEVTSAEEEDSESEVLEVADRDKNQTSFFEENEKMDEDYTQYFDETIKRANQDAVFQPSENMNLEEFVHKSIENTQNETFVNQSVDKSKTLMHSSFEQQPMQNLFSHNLEVEAMNEQVQNDSRSLSEKLKTTINGDLKQMIMNENLWKDPEALQTVIDFIFEKVIQNPEFVEFYSELCLNLYIAEQSTEESNGKTLFLAMIIQKFENIFKQGLTEFLKTITEIQKQVFEERNDLKAQLNEMIQKKRQQMFGIFNILYHNVETNRNGLMIEFFVELIKNIGPFAAKKKSEDSKIVDNYINDFTYRCQVKREATNEVNFMIAKLLKQKQKWIEKEETFEDAAMKDGCTSADIIALSGYQQDLFME
uniref:MIF4G domain-containing protein n=1 Tax=Panagrolaimus sp. ES5 TaxID=591445 RepID=A0AC34EZN1_9BILA